MLLCLALCASILLGMSISVFAEGEEKAGVTVSSVTLNKKGTAVTVSAAADKDYLSKNEGDTLYLIKLEAWEDSSSLAGKQPVDDLKLKKAEFSFKCDFEAETDRFCSYVVAEKKGDEFVALSDDHYVDGLGTLADDTTPYPTYATKKGLIASDDAQLLLTGSSQTVIDIKADEYLLPSSTTDSTSFVYGGVTYYVSQSALDTLDRRVNFLCDSGVNIFGRLSLSGKYRGTDTRLAALYYNDAADGASGYALNTSSKEAMAYYIAFVEYLTDRYGTPDGEFGHIGSWIVGIDIDTNELTNSAGERWMSAYVDSYSRMLRVTYASAVSKWSEARVYVPFSNCWNARPNNSSLLYNSNLVLNALNAEIRAEGDFGWRVAIDARPSDLTLSQIWQDEAAEDKTGSGYITMKNLSVLTDYLAGEGFAFEGEARRVAVTGFAVTSNPKAPTDMTQAAAFVYAYHRAAFNDSVDAFIYSVYSDADAPIADLPASTAPADDESADEETAEEGDESSDTAVDAVTPDEVCLGLVDDEYIEKPIYDVFCSVDAAMIADPEYKSGSASNFALSYVGITDWREVVPSYNLKNTEKRGLVDSLSILGASIPAKQKSTEIADFEKGDFGGFYAAAGAEYTELRTVENVDGLSSAMLYVGLTPNGGTANMGVACDLDGLKAARAEYITFDLFVEAPVDVATVEVVFTLRSAADEDHSEGLYRATASVKPNEWQELAFKTTDLIASVERLDSLGIWISSYDGLDHEGSWAVILDNVTAHGARSNVFWKVVGTIFLVLLIIFVLLVAALFALRVYNVRRINKRRAAEAARRRARARRQAMMQGQRLPQGYPQQGQPARRPPQYPNQATGQGPDNGPGAGDYTQR